MRLRAQAMAPYQVTSDDALWLARAVEAEGAPQAQVAAVLLNGFTFVRSRGYAKPLATFIRAYAQPLNPRWYLTGDLFIASLANKSDSEQAEARATAERRERVHSTRVSFSPTTQQAVIAALNGRVVIPPNATDYAAAHVDATGKGYTPLTPVQPKTNRLWARGGAEKWAGYTIDATDAWPWLVGAVMVMGLVAWRHWGGA